MKKFADLLKTVTTKDAVILGATVATVAAVGVVSYKAVKAYKAAKAQAATVAPVAEVAAPLEGEIVKPESKEDQAANNAKPVNK